MRFLADSFNARLFAKKIAPWLIAVGLALPCLYFLFQQRYSLLFLLAFLALILIVWHLSKDAGMALSLLFLLFMGDIRRIATGITGPQPMDLLILVGALTTGYFAVPSLVGVRLKDSLSKGVLAALAIMVFGVLNPIQGNITTGLSGALFFITPVLWFWISRRYSTERTIYLILYRMLVPVGCLAALFGIYQTYVGFFPWQQEWVKASVRAGYQALDLGNGHIRSFGFSSSSAEYGHLLAMSSVVIIAAALAGRKAYLVLLPLLLTAQLLASQRSPILTLIGASAILWAFRTRDIRIWLPRLLLGVPLALGALFFIASRADTGESSTSKSGNADLATRHVTQGLAHPLDPKYSTGALHLHLFWIGVKHGFDDPLGDGLGAVTMGADKFGGVASVPGSTEIDLSDLFVTTGFIGGLVYLVLVILGFMTGVSYLRVGPAYLSMPIFGILLCMFTAWIPQGQYAVGPIVWFCLGFLSTRAKEQKTPVVSRQGPVRTPLQTHSIEAVAS